MRHTLHHLCWLLHRFRVMLIIYGCAWASLFAAVWLVLGAPHANAVSLGLHAVLPIIALLLLKDVLWQDAAPGTHEFWRTRPARWRAVWSSQTIFLCVFLAGPPLLCWALNGLLLDSSAQQWRFGMVDALLFLCPFIALAGILSFSRGWYSLALSFVAAAGCFIGGILVIAQNIGLTGFHFGTLDSDLRPRFAGYLGIGALVLALSWVAGMRRPGIRWRAIITGAALLVMPAVVQQIGMSPREAQPVALALVMNDTPRAELLRQGTNPEGLILQGVPDFAEAVIYDSDIRMSFIETTNFHGEVSGKAGEFPLWSGPPQRVFCYAAIPRKGLRALFPADCRWYSSVREEPRRPRQFDYLDANRLNVAEVKFRLIGTAQGLFVSAQRLVAVRLEVGSRAAENGSRVKILASDENWYEIQVLEHGRPNTNPFTADRGWINKKFVKFD